MEKTTEIIEVRDIRKEYRNGAIKTDVLQGISLKVFEGDFLAIMGPSGSGKSTLMHIMGFLDRPSSGICNFRGYHIDSLSDDELARIRNKKMGFIFQMFNLLARTTVLDNVRLPLFYSGLKGKKELELAKEAIESVGLTDRSHHLPNQLSGGERQRVAIARAIVNNPEVIFADEPTGNLDSKSGQQIMDVLQKLNNQGHTIVLVTHEKYTAEMAKKIILLKDGKIVYNEKVNHRRFAKDGFKK